MTDNANPKCSYTIIFIGLLFFVCHLGLILHHTYITASKKNTITFPGETIEHPQRWHNYLDLNRFDSGHYERTVLTGYKNPRNTGEPLKTVMWFPGYPLMAKCIYKITGWKPSLIFSILSALFTLAFWLIFWSPKMVAVFGKKVLIVASLLILCWHGGFYWFAGMTEPLIALLFVVILYLWISEKFNWLVVVLCYATSVKQTFIPVSIAIFTLEIIRSRPKLWPMAVKFLISISGFIAYCLYCGISFGNPFLFSEMNVEFYKRKISFLNLINLSHYAQNMGSLDGITALFSMVFLLVITLQLSGQLKNLWTGYFKKTPNEITTDVVLWWTALAYTTFCITGAAYGLDPFMSMMRFQTVDIPLFLLLAFQFREMKWWKIICLLAPVLWISLYWQNIYTVKYWLWEWVS